MNYAICILFIFFLKQQVFSLHQIIHGFLFLCIKIFTYNYQEINTLQYILLYFMSKFARSIKYLYKLFNFLFLYYNNFIYKIRIVLCKKLHNFILKKWCLLILRPPFRKKKRDWSKYVPLETVPLSPEI